MCLILFTVIVLMGYLYPIIRDKILNRPPRLLYFPILGNIYPYLMKNIPKYKVFKELAQTHGSIFTFNMADKKFVVVNTADVVSEIYQKGTTFAGRSPNFSLDLVSTKYKEAFKIIHGKHWKLLRKVGHNALTKHGIKQKDFEKTLSDETENLIAMLSKQSGKVIDPTRDLMLAIVNITTETVFGERFAFGDGKFECIEEILNLSFNKSPTMKTKNLLKMLLGRNHTSLPKEKHPSENTLEELIAKHQKRYDENCTIDNVATGIIDEIEKISQKLNITNKETKSYLIYTIVFEVYFSSLEPILATLTWTLVLISRWKKIQNNISKKLDHSGKLELQETKSLNYLRAVLYETQRYASVVPLYPRLCTHNTTLGGYNIPKDTTLLINCYALHFDEKVWHSPNTFNPSRWLNEYGNFKLVNSSSFVPFGGGMRRCFGEVMAKQELLFMLGNLLKHFEFDEVAGSKHDISAKEGTFNVTGRFKVLIKARN